MISITPQPVKAALHGRDGLVAHPAFERIRASAPERFRSTVRTAHLTLLHAQVSQLSACTVEGLAPNPGRAPANRFVMVAVADRESQLTAPAPAGQTDCAAGQLVILAPGARFSWQFSDPVRITSLSVPVNLLNEFGESRWRGATMLSCSPLNRATGDFVGQFALDAVSGHHPVRSRAEHVVVDLIRAAVDRDVWAAGNEEAYVRAAVRELIDREFAEPGLSVARVAELLSMSRRQLYRYFEGSDQTVADLIAARRLESARELLSAPDRLSMAQVAQASGFNSTGTLRRRFEQSVGMSPRDYQQRMRALDRSADDAPAKPPPLRPTRPVSDAYEAI